MFMLMVLVMRMAVVVLLLLLSGLLHVLFMLSIGKEEEKSLELAKHCSTTHFFLLLVVVVVIFLPLLIGHLLLQHLTRAYPKTRSSRSRTHSH